MSPIPGIFTNNEFVYADGDSSTYFNVLNKNRKCDCLSGLIPGLLLMSAFIAASATTSFQTPAGWPDEWNLIGRAQIQTKTNSVTIEDGYLVNRRLYDDGEMSFQARMPVGADQVQIWAGLHFRDRDSRYVFALRGGNDNDLYLARYAPDGGIVFLGFAPLDFKPISDVWYRLRAVSIGDRIELFLNDEKLPRLSVKDPNPLWNAGSFLLGGGYLPVEFRDLQIKQLTPDEKSAFIAIGNKTQRPTTPVDKEALRKKERAGYLPQSIPTQNLPRADVSLNGDWLFIPDFQLPAGSLPVQLDYDDMRWHVMQVPSFWTPGLSWLHGETGFPGLDEFSKTKGIAESLYVQRIEKCDSYTFNWRKTHAAWYRHYIELPSDIAGRRFQLTFDAIAKVSKVWINGVEVGDHTGMFGQVKCDITKAVRPGTNVIAVHVISMPTSDSASASKVEGVAVTVEVTSSMLHSLPHGMFQEDVGGIWQPVTLTETAPAHISDCFIEPGLHGADINIEVLNSGNQSEKLRLEYLISSVSDGTLLYSNRVEQPFVLDAGATNQMRLTTPYLNPKLWSPHEPNLYNLELRLKSEDKVIDSYNTRFGFRTFTVDSNKFLLNGQPFWLRGADPFPNTLEPNDKELARRFMQIAREGNVCVTRSHIVPFTSTWMDAADEVGMAVSFEGTWPWLMLQGDPPSDSLIKAWKDEFISLIKENRNHPSLVMWTVNNEMKFEEFDQDRPERLKKKWGILNETIKDMRAADPTRPIVADSAYVRKDAMRGYQSVVKPLNFDDGDVDDIHSYFGWYNQSFFHFYDGQLNEHNTPGRPLISQEMSTGYPNNDDGHPARFYLFKNYTPQALVGDDAYENADPAIFLTRQAFMTKELAETFRRTSHEGSAGILYFSYFTWFQTPWSVNDIKPWPAYYALKTALQPVFISAELYGRHFYSDTGIHTRVCVVNDSENCQATPSDSRLIWSFQNKGRILSHGQMEVPAVDYYKNHWSDVELRTPQDLPLPRIDGQLKLRLESEGKAFSENSYDVVVATHDWANGGSSKKTSLVFWNPGKESADCLSGVPMTVVDSIDAVDPANVLIVGNLTETSLTGAELDQLKSLIARGGRVLMLHPGKILADLFPDQVKSYKAKEGEIVSMHIPESPIFCGIEPLDIAWFDRGKRRLPLACNGVFHVASERDDTVILADQCDLHGYLRAPSEIASYSGTPLVELKINQGRVIASELNLEAGGNDPIARRLLMNMIGYLER